MDGFYSYFTFLVETTINHRVSILYLILYSCAILILGGNLAWVNYQNLQESKKARIAELELQIESLEMDKVFNARPAHILDQEIAEYKQQIERYGNYKAYKRHD